MATEKEKDVRWGRRFQSLRNGNGLSQKELSDSGIGLSLPTIQRYEAGELPGAKSINKIVTYFKCNKVWLLDGQGEPFPGARAKYPEVCGPETVRNDDDITGEFVFIPQMAGAISAGGGLAPENQVEMRVAFRQDWIARKGAPQNMSMIKVNGDSMAPTLLSGDLVLVDHSRNNIASQCGIYAVSLDHEIMIKRLQPLPAGKILVISDNKQYTNIEINQSDIHVNGQVLWYAREIER